MRNLSLYAITVVFFTILLGVVLGIVALIDLSLSDTNFHEPENVVVTYVQDTLIPGYIDPVTSRYVHDYRNTVITLKTDDSTTIDFHPAFVPDDIHAGDTVRLYRSHSPLFNFAGDMYVIEHNGEFDRSF